MGDKTHLSGDSLREQYQTTQPPAEFHWTDPERLTRPIEPVKTVYRPEDKLHSIFTDPRARNVSFNERTGEVVVQVELDSLKPRTD